MTVTRRDILLGGACSLAAHPLATTASFAAAPGDARLVVIILRGAMDGLDVVRPVGDPLYQAYRPTLAGAGEDLTGYFALHPSLAKLMPMWRRGELGFAHAVSTPYRDKRSHFDGQDLLEAGIGMGGRHARGGWLNRFIETIPGAEPELTFGVGNDPLNVVAGRAPVSRWAPDVDVDLTPQAELLLRHIYAPDPMFAAAAETAIELAGAIKSTDLPKLSTGDKADPVAAFAAERMLGDTRLAAFSLNGWDTHQQQGRGIRGSLNTLSRMLLTLNEHLGAAWGKTLVLAMTEFGRTVAENGTQGTDHGTAGAMVLAGGALRGGQVFGAWPGLDEAALYQRRDLMATDDVRRYAAWAMRGMWGTDRAALEGAIFPGLDLGSEVELLI